MKLSSGEKQVITHLIYGVVFFVVSWVYHKTNGQGKWFPLFPLLWVIFLFVACVHDWVKRRLRKKG